jgi:hypothetical protein
MKIRELYMDALIKKHSSLQLLIEFLVYEKKVVSFEDDEKALDLYFMEKHQERMNKLLLEYNLNRNVLKETKELQVYQIRKNDTFYYVAAYIKEQAENFFKSKYGEFNQIRIELPELMVEGKNGIFSLKQHMMNAKTVPSILGQWELIGGEENEQVRTANHQTSHRNAG